MYIAGVGAYIAPSALYKDFIPTSSVRKQRIGNLHCMYTLGSGYQVKLVVRGDIPAHGTIPLDPTLAYKYKSWGKSTECKARMSFIQRRSV